MTAQGQARSLHKRERAASGGLHHESLHGQTGYENDLCRGALEEYWPGKAVLVLKKRMLLELRPKIMSTWLRVLFV